MPVITASQLVLSIILGLVGITLAFVVGHVIEKDVKAVGEVVGEQVPKLLTLPVIAATVGAIYLLTRRGKPA